MSPGSASSPAFPRSGSGPSSRRQTRAGSLSSIADEEYLKPAPASSHRGRRVGAPPTSSSGQEPQPSEWHGFFREGLTLFTYLHLARCLN